jgi:hypothetical protein
MPTGCVASIAPHLMPDAWLVPNRQSRFLSPNCPLPFAALREALSRPQSRSSRPGPAIHPQGRLDDEAQGRSSTFSKRRSPGRRKGRIHARPYHRSAAATWTGQHSKCRLARVRSGGVYPLVSEEHESTLLEGIADAQVSTAGVDGCRLDDLLQERATARNGAHTGVRNEYDMAVRKDM